MKAPGIETQSALRLFINQTKNTRAENLYQKRLQYEKELDSLDSNSERAGIISGLIALCNQASEHHSQLTKRLTLDDKVSVLGQKKGALDRKETIKASVLLERLDRINNHPNEVERLIEEIEKTDQEIENEITALTNRNPPAAIPPLLIQVQQAIKESLTHYRTLIQLKSASAELIKPSFEEIDRETQAAIEASKTNVIRTAALAQERYLSAKYKLSRFIRENNVNVILLQDAWMDHVDRSLSEVTLEAQREEPRPEVINSFLHSAELSQQAIDEHDILVNDINDVKFRQQRSYYFHFAGDSLFNATKETQREEPRQEVIDRFLLSFKLYQQAVAALDNNNDPNRFKRADYLSEEAYNHCYLALEYQREEPRQEVIDRFLNAIELNQQAIAALGNQTDCFRVKRAAYLNSAGYYLRVVAMEYQKDNPDLEHIKVVSDQSNYLKSIALYSPLIF